MPICEIEIIPSAMPWRRLVEAIARWRRAQRQQRELRMLDPSALRDLGLDRSELASYAAEASGAAHCTRRRVVGAALCPTGLRPISAIARFVVSAVGAVAVVSAGIVVFGPLADASAQQPVVVTRLLTRPADNLKSHSTLHGDFSCPNL